MRVHILWNGRPLCRFSSVLPGHWPDGERWTHVAAADRATCSGCIVEHGLATWPEGTDRCVAPAVPALQTAMEPMTVRRGAIEVRRSALGNLTVETVGPPSCELHVASADVTDLISALAEVERANDAGRVSLSTTSIGEPPGPAFASPPQKAPP